MTAERAALARRQRPLPGNGSGSGPRRQWDGVRGCCTRASRAGSGRCSADGVCRDLLIYVSQR